MLRDLKQLQEFLNKQSDEDLKRIANAVNKLECEYQDHYNGLTDHDPKMFDDINDYRRISLILSWLGTALRK